MLKKFWIKKIIVSCSALFALFLLCLIPKHEKNVLKEVKQELEYTNIAINKHEIYLMDVNGYLARTTVSINSNDVTGKAKEILNTLIIGSSGESKIPNGFRGIIPADTKVSNLEFKDGVLKVNFSSDLLDVKKELEEKVIEAIVYNLTSIEGVEKVIIFVDGNILIKLPQTGINLPSSLDRSFGINKEYDLKSTKDITDVTIYYVNKYNNNEYYVPVTKYINDDREKIQIIVDELAGTTTYNSNLMSYLNSNTKLLTISETIDKIDLVFNNYILDNMTDKDILEEVIYTISLSVKDNYDVTELVFKVDDEEIYKTNLKILE